MNISVPVPNTMEIIERTAISPLVSKCRIKVCYVGEQPNRNHTVITREVAEEMGRKLPGSPIVGYYNEETQDFEQHNRELDIKNGKFKLIDTTKAYGFVAPDATIWFEKYNDNGVEHEYLCTEGYIWTGAYPESKRIIDKGNNHSMEIDKDSPGKWTNDVNSGDRIFIYNEALIEKLCVLGEKYEPCFEGSQITAFSLNRAEFEEFKTRMFSMISELQEAVNTNKGGSNGTMDENTKNVLEGQEQDPADPNYVKKPDEDENKKNNESEGNSDKEKNQNSENKSERQENKESEEQKDEEDKKKKYSLEDVAEYQELKTQFDDLTNKYSALEADYNTLVSEKTALDTEIAGLREFKLATEKDQKQAMIDSFYMLSDEDKKDVIDNINTYSLDDIEAKLSVICVRNKLNLSEVHSEENGLSMFSLQNAADSDTAPAWIKAVRENNKF